MVDHVHILSHRLKGLSQLKEKTNSAEINILYSARDRLLIVNSDIGKLEKKVLLDNSLVYQYNNLIKERSRLVQVITNAECRLK